MSKFLDLNGLETLWGRITSKLSTKADKDGSNATGTWAISTTGNAGSATKLDTARTIDGISFDGTADVTRYAVCDTEAATADKVATMYDGSTFVLDVGARVTVKFTYGNTAYPPTLNVAGTGAKSIPSENSDTYGNPHARYWGANSVVDFIYNGTNWNIVGLSNVGRTESNGGEVFNDYYNNKATGERAHAEGYQTEASGSYSHAEGNETKAIGMRSHAEGYQTEASGYYAHAEGCTTLASDNAAHAEGYYSKATNDYDHAEGYHTTASGGYGAHAEGYYTTASGNSGSHAEGYYAEASGGYAHAEGYQTQASDYGAHAEGANTVASSSYAHAEGYQTTASGSNSHAEGYGTKASSENAHVQGKYNLDDTSSKYAHIVGNGSGDSSRSNAHTLDWSGVGWFAGGVKVGGTSQDDASRVYAENYKPALTDLSGTLAITNGGTGATTADGACDNIGAVKKSGDTMTGDLIIKSTRPGFHLKSSDDSLGRMWLTKETSDGVGYCVAERADTKFSGLYFDATAGVNDRVNVVDNIDGNWVRSPIYHNNMTIQIPIAQGGTGANTAAQARHNIGADHVYNLLDNSDFRNPVNSQGKTSYYGNEPMETIDRWEIVGTMQNVGSGNITLTSSHSTVTDLTQSISGLQNGIYTQALNVNGTIYTRIIELSNSKITTIDESNAAYPGGRIEFRCVSSTKKCYFAFYVEPKYSINVLWAALYEGAYTVDMLPPYVPKGKHVEMLNCNIPLTPHNLLDNSDFTNPVNQRGATTTSQYKYFLDRWIARLSDISLAVGNSGLTLTSSATANIFIYQKLLAGKALNGKTVTVAVCDGTGNVATTTTNLPTTNATSWTSYAVAQTNNGVYASVIDLGSGDYPIAVRVGVQSDALNKTIRWAALYEGSYTADTIPAYQPKGYAAELAECKLHYRIMQTPCIPCANNPAGNQVYGYIQGTMRIAPTVICDNLFYFQGDGTYTQVTGATAALAGDGIRIAFDLAQSVSGNLAGVVGGTAITLDANM